MTSSSARRLRVSGRAVAEYLDLPPATFQRGADAGLFGSADGGGYDAETVLRLGRREFVADDEWQRFDARSVLLVQQTSAHRATAAVDLSWRDYWGWSSELSPRQALDSAAGWWQIAPANLRRVVALVSTVASFVVTIALVDSKDRVAGEHDGRIRLNVEPATDATPLGRALLRTFDQRRIPSRNGQTFFLPATAAGGASEASD